MTIPDQHASAEITQPFQRIEVAPPASPSSPPASSARGFGGLVGWVKDEVAALPRPDRERQPCAAEWREYSRRGVWTTEPAATPEKTGRQRGAHEAYTKFFAGPVMAACDWIKYIVARPERFGALVSVVALFALGVFLLVVV